jgi:NAD(P)-dependent dehydrogenase (short-subunit alcohol dehydrogenase family)
MPVIGITKTVAMEYAKNNIRVNAICPVFTVTPMFDPEAMDKLKSGISEKLKANVPMKRFANVMEQVSTMLWLCSDEASFITGQAISVDGGLTA